MSKDRFRSFTLVSVEKDDAFKVDYKEYKSKKAKAVDLSYTMNYVESDLGFLFVTFVWRTQGCTLAALFLFIV